jgi:solute carrier family 35 protein E1
MKLIVALAASAAAFTGPAARLPAVARTTQLKTEQPSMLLSGVRARANALVCSGVQDAAFTARRATLLTRPRAQVATKAEASASGEKKGMLAGLDAPLLAYFFFWYLGNFYYNISNKTALKAAGGALGYPMTISTLQLGVGSLYALFLWAAPDARPFPKITAKDVVRLLPLAFCAAGAHAGSVFALSAGAVSFGQIVKAAEPAFAAVIGTKLYGKKISKAKWLCLIPVIGGVCLASLKELDFAMSALVAACTANVFAAFKGNENAKVMAEDGLKDRLGSVGNQFALTTILAFLLSIPVVVLKGESWVGFTQLWKTNPVVRFNVLASGLWFYGYNELATMTIKKTSAVTQSVANTAKRVIVIVGVAVVMGESLNPLKLAGCGIGIGGVFLYSVIDQLLAKKK